MRLLIIAPLVTLAGCMQFAEIETAEPIRISTSLKSEIKKEVTRDFLDPESARFRDIRAVDVTLANGKHEKRVCGEVNGKNAMGGYVGYSMFGGVIINGDFQQRDFFSPCEN